MSLETDDLEWRLRRAERERRMEAFRRLRPTATERAIVITIIIVAIAWYLIV